ncbi:MAG: hypothetical protein KME38_29035 [Spirirestis rafaelensis WJT71-NPBG6]|nr:hypothetical protein [Spirirestis rafaelensis WJT71-NPBG6]
MRSPHRPKLSDRPSEIHQDNRTMKILPSVLMLWLILCIPAIADTTNRGCDRRSDCQFTPAKAV